MEEGTAFLTFSCTAEGVGTYEVSLENVVCSDGNFEEAAYVIRGESATVSLCQHVFTDYVSNGDATCTEDGTKTAPCANGCGAMDTVTDEGSALGHSFTQYVSNGDAICEEDGTRTAICDRCDETDTVVDEGTAPGHFFYRYVSNNDATCTEDGTKTVLCECCGAPDTVTDEGTALGHAFSDYISNGDATCTADGTKTAACDHGCGETDTVTDTGSMLPHAYEEGICRHCGQLDPDAAFLNISIICKTEPTLTVLIKGPNGVSISVTADENGDCCFGGLLPGSYTVTVSAGNHVSRTLEITLVKGENGLETFLSLQGDVDNNGRVNIIDLAQIYSHIKGVSRLRDEYAIACADIIAGGLNIIDLAQLYARIKAA